MPISMRRFKPIPKMTMPRSQRRKGEAYEACLPPGDQSRYFALAYSVRRVSQALNAIRVKHRVSGHRWSREIRCRYLAAGLCWRA